MKEEKTESSSMMLVVLTSIEHHHVLANCAYISLYYTNKNFRVYCSQVCGLW